MSMAPIDGKKSLEKFSVMVSSSAVDSLVASSLVLAFTLILCMTHLLRCTSKSIMTFQYVNRPFNGHRRLNGWLELLRVSCTVLHPIING